MHPYFSSDQGGKTGVMPKHNALCPDIHRRGGFFQRRAEGKGQVFGGQDLVLGALVLCKVNFYSLWRHLLSQLFVAKPRRSFGYGCVLRRDLTQNLLPIIQKNLLYKALVYPLEVVAFIDKMTVIPGIPYYFRIAHYYHLFSRPGNSDIQLPVHSFLIFRYNGVELKGRINYC